MRQSINMIQKDVKQIGFTAGYIWVLDNHEKVFQWPILKKFDENKNIQSYKLGDKR